jgi:MoaA/NifB/PqqE/SkfB family radical SAM enzyme
MTVMNSNVNLISEFVRKVAKHGSFWVDLHGVQIFKRANLIGPYSKPSDEVFRANLLRACKEGKRLGLKITYNRTDVNSKPKTSSIPVPCGMPWTSSFIDFKGTVHLCCFNLNSFIGNATKTPLHELWKNAAYQKLRADILSNSEPFCKNCLSGELWRNFI